MKRSFAVVSFIIILIAACKKIDTTDSTVPLQTNFTNVAYGSDTAQVMDVYLPANRSTTYTNALIMIHGGGWNSGDKTDLASWIDTMQRRFPTYAIFNLNYRLATGTINLFPTQENDIRSAVAFIYSKRFDYFISANYAIMGESEGAHLALLEAYKDTTPIRIKSVIDFYGPTDMRAMFYDPAPLSDSATIKKLFGDHSPLEDSLSYALSSPINFITPRVTPTFIVHGGIDQLVRHEQSDSLYAHLDSANVSRFYKVYGTQDHGWANSDTLHDSFNNMQAFLKAIMP